MQQPGESPGDSREQTGTILVEEPSSPAGCASDCTPDGGRPALADDRRQRRRLTTDQLEVGKLALAKLEMVIDYRRLRMEANWKEIKRETGVSPVEFCRWKKRLAKEQLTLQSPRSELIKALARIAPPGRKPKYAFTETEADKLTSHVLQSNRTATAGSPQEATRHGIKRGDVGPELAATLKQREVDGLPLLTTALRRQIEVGETTTRAHRTPREAWLQYVDSPGSLQITIDEKTGEERMFQPGEAWTIDDATINFCCCVPLERPGDKCWDKFGVMVGRFQFIVIADHRSYFIPGFSYTARPRGSYRAEDLTGTIQIAGRQHGIPRKMFLEHGVSASKLVHETLKKAGIGIHHVKSPHQKVVELLFNKLWTKLSFLPGQVGRNMKDDEETNKLLTSCRAGATDPRKHFLMLDQVVKALREAIEDHNGQVIAHSRYGRWTPKDFWADKSASMLRPLDEGCDWMFSPVVTEPRVVHGFKFRHTVKLMDGLSQVFHFGADWLQAFHGATIKAFFNPFLDAPAKVVLVQDFRGTRAETVLGDAEMIDRHARFNLRKMGYGEFPDIGLAAARSHAQSLRRMVQAIRPDGKQGITTMENRQMAKHINVGENTAPRNDLGAPSHDEFAVTRSRLAADAARARARRSPATVPTL